MNWLQSVILSLDQSINEKIDSEFSSFITLNVGILTDVNINRKTFLTVVYIPPKSVTRPGVSQPRFFSPGIQTTGVAQCFREFQQRTETCDNDCSVGQVSVCDWACHVRVLWCLCLELSEIITRIILANIICSRKWWRSCNLPQYRQCHSATVQSSTVLKYQCSTVPQYHSAKVPVFYSAKVTKYQSSTIPHYHSAKVPQC